eukprot:m.19036 g.19036  ORF g.19036 m.19036 type:complete len:414 (-) comp3398_c0_seq1:270-1511(-)
MCMCLGMWMSLSVSALLQTRSRALAAPVLGDGTQVEAADDDVSTRGADACAVEAALEIEADIPAHKVHLDELLGDVDLSHDRGIPEALGVECEQRRAAVQGEPPHPRRIGREAAVLLPRQPLLLAQGQLAVIVLGTARAVLVLVALVQLAERGISRLGAGPDGHPPPSAQAGPARALWRAGGLLGQGGQHEIATHGEVHRVLECGVAVLEIDQWPRVLARVAETAVLNTEVDQVDIARVAQGRDGILVRVVVALLVRRRHQLSAAILLGDIDERHEDVEAVRRQVPDLAEVVAVAVPRLRRGPRHGEHDPDVGENGIRPDDRLDQRAPFRILVQERERFRSQLLDHHVEAPTRAHLERRETDILEVIMQVEPLNHIGELGVLGVHHVAAHDHLVACQHVLALAIAFASECPHT